MTTNSKLFILSFKRPGHQASDDLVDAFAGRVPVRFLALHSLDGESFDLAINATSLGLRASDAPPLPLDTGPSIGAALDLVYSSASTPWVRALQARGVPAADGLEMLIFQGAASFERWWGIPAPIDAMRASLTRPAAPVP